MQNQSRGHNNILMHNQSKGPVMIKLIFRMKIG